jgi:hypothetical protein
MRRWIGLCAALSCIMARQVAAQCVPPTNSNEARLLAFYEAPLVFSFATQPQISAPWTVRVGGELSPIPTPDPAIERTGYCFTQKTEHTRLAPVFGRPRIAVALPAGFVVEASYLPPVTISDAQPNMGSLALSYSHGLPLEPGGYPLLFTVRAHGTTGRVRGPITCPASELQESDPVQPCFGRTPSHDTFKPHMFGAEGAVGTTTHNGRLGVYAGAGVLWLRPRFQVGFTDGNGAVDRTQVEVDLTRATIFGGLTLHLPHGFDISGQLYDVPVDAATWRVGAGWRFP